MTGSPDQIRRDACARAQPRARGWLAHARVLPALLLIAAALALGPARADDLLEGKVTATTDHGFARLVFKFDQLVPARVTLNWPIMIIHFDKGVDVSVDRLNARAPGYISAARRDPDGTAVRIALARKVKFHVIPAGERLFIDLLPEDWSGLLPGLPQEVIDELARRANEADKLLKRARIADGEAIAKTIRVKVATQPTFTRYVFDLPLTTHVAPEHDDGTFALNFDEPIKWDLADALAALPETLQSIETVRVDHSAVVRFKLNGSPQVRTFRDGQSFVVDVGEGSMRRSRRWRRAPRNWRRPRRTRRRLRRRRPCRPQRPSHRRKAATCRS